MFIQLVLIVTSILSTAVTTALHLFVYHDLEFTTRKLAKKLLRIEFVLLNMRKIFFVVVVSSGSLVD